MSVAGYRASIFIENGATVDFADLATTIIPNTNNYQINDSTKRVFDVNANFIVKKDGTIIDESLYILDYFNGVISFNSLQNGVVTISGKFQPIVKIVGATAYQAKLINNLAETTEIGVTSGDAGYKTRNITLQDIDLNLTRFVDIVQDLLGKLRARKTLFICINFVGMIVKSWFLITDINTSGDVGNLQVESINCKLNSINLNDLSNVSFEDVVV